MHQWYGLHFIVLDPSTFQFFPSCIVTGFTGARLTDYDFQFFPSCIISGTVPALLFFNHLRLSILSQLHQVR
ncbi:MAG: hypothetical protein N3E41_08695 [Thermofilaceae archaeon]|nr:hypothetical protein [Thermofilaceae archaeon]